MYLLMSGKNKRDNSKKKKEKLPFKLRFRSFIAGIKKYIRLKKLGIIKFLKSKDFKVAKEAIYKIILDGAIFAGIAGIIIGFHDKLFLIKLIPILGAGWYIIKKEVFPELRSILSSFVLIKTGK